MRNSVCRLAWIAAFAWGAWLGTPVAGQSRVANQRDLVLSVRTLMSRARTQAPIPIELNLANTKRQVVRGNLELTLWVGTERAARIDLPDLALSPGENRRRLMLPEVALESETTVVTIEGWFQRGTERLDLGDNHDVVVPSFRQRNLVILDVTEGNDELQRAHVALRDSLELQRYDPLGGDAAREVGVPRDGEGRVDRRRRGLVVNPSLLEPTEFPESSGLLCGTDVVLLSSGGLQRLRLPQLQALTEWVRAGGSLCVELPVGEPVSAATLQTLNMWANTGAAGPRYLSVPGGRELIVVESTVEEPALGANRPTVPGVWLTRPGWGRVALIERSDLPPEWFSGSDWLLAIGHLWRINRQALQALRDSHPNPRWPRTRGSDPISPRLTADEAYQPRFNSTVELLSRIMQPQAVTRLPVGRFLAVLFLFFLVVIPGDYYGLGWLRGRRWTWAFVPACSVLFAWLISSMAEAVLGPQGFRHAIVVTDLDSSGATVRRHALELVMVPSPQVLKRDLTDSLYLNLSRWERSLHLAPSLTGGLNQTSNSAEVSPRGEPPVVYDGLAPGRYGVSEPLRRWSPVLTRVTSLGVEREPQQLDWSEVARADWSDWETLVQRVRKVAPTAQVMKLGGETGLRSDNGEARERPSDQMLLAVRLTGTPHSGESWTTGLPGVGSQSVIEAPDPWFEVVDQVSPSGSGTLEDLRLREFLSAEANCEVLLIVVPDPERTTIHRVLRGGS